MVIYEVSNYYPWIMGVRYHGCYYIYTHTHTQNKHRFQILKDYEWIVKCCLYPADNNVLRRNLIINDLITSNEFFWPSMFWLVSFIVDW